jgi:hypothetical protein
MTRRRRTRRRRIEWSSSQKNHNMPLDTEISIAACNGVRACSGLVEMLDRGVCNGFEVEYSADPVTRVYVRAYTPFPPMYFTSENGGCGNGTEVRFMYKNETDAESMDSPYWRVFSRFGFERNEKGQCVYSSENVPDQSLMVVDLRGFEEGEIIEFGRLVNMTTADSVFESGNARAEWTGTYADVRFEMDERYTFPGCCALPLNFTDSEHRLWRQSASEIVCGVLDSAEYAYMGTQPTLTSSHNETHDVWRFEVSSPNYTEGCGTSPLFDSFVVDAYVKVNDSALTESHTSPPRWLASSEIQPQDPGWILLISLCLTCASVFLVVSRNAWLQYMHVENQTKKGKR